MNGSKNCGTFTQWNTMQQKEGAPTLCDSINGSGEHYAKWNKPGGEISYDLTYKWNLINKTNKQAKYNQRHWFSQCLWLYFPTHLCLQILRRKSKNKEKQQKFQCYLSSDYHTWDWFICISRLCIFYKKSSLLPNPLMNLLLIISDRIGHRNVPDHIKA